MLAHPTDLLTGHRSTLLAQRQELAPHGLHLQLKPSPTPHPIAHLITKDLSFPRYRLRFYKDGSRNEITAELPPALPPKDPFSPRFDSDGNPITGPNFFGPQLFTTDPGRAGITGSPYDFEVFDIPTLRGIGRTAPYWHNNISETLEGVVELYCDHLLSKFPSLSLPGDKDPDPAGDIGPPEALTAQQKSDLVAYLKRL